MKVKLKLPKGTSIVCRTSPITGVKSYQGHVRRPGQRTLCETYPSWDLAYVYITDLVKKIKSEEALVAAAAEALESGDLFEERLETSCDKFLTSIECTDRHRNTMSGLQKMIGVVGNPAIKELTKNWIKTFIAKGRKTNSVRGKPYAYSTLHSFLSLVSVVVTTRADELDQVAPAFHVKSQYYEKVARAAGEEWRDGAYFAKRQRRLEAAENEEQRLRSAIVHPDPATQKQLRLLLDFALTTGARRKELVSASWNQISPAGLSWNIPRGKTKPRSMTLSEEAKVVIAELSSMREAGNPRIFHKLRSPRSAGDQIIKAIKRAGIEGLTFHDLRHEGITRFVASQRMDIALLMPMVGHSDPKITALYTHLNEMELEKMMVAAKAKA